MNEWYIKNREKHLEGCRQWYLNHRDESIEYNKNRYRNNRDEFLEKSKLRYQNQKTTIDEIRKTDEYKFKKALYVKIRRRNDIEFKIAGVLRGMIYSRIKRKTKFPKRYEEIIGYSLEQFIKHIESKFKTGMTWKNHSTNGWHIDHIKSCCEFDLTNENDIHKCFHYTNMQPLWAEEHRKKKWRKIK